MQKRSILIIDDDLINLEVLEDYLKLGSNADHEIIRAINGKEGLEVLHDHADSIDVILLDRMMPVMSGIDFMHEFNKNEFYKNIPVIMQTASDLREHMAEGFQLGVYHYLIKPLSPMTLNSIVHSAIELYKHHRILTSDLKNTKNLFKYVEHAAFQIRTLEDANIMSVSLASLFPDPTRVVNGISEILVNAIEHGNLGITYDEKTHLNLTHKWEDEIARRLNLPENQNKNVIITFYRSDGEFRLNVKDHGQGFNYKKYLNFDPSRGTDNHGRGIAFANNLSFDSLQYIGCGNEVLCLVQTKH